MSVNTIFLFSLVLFFGGCTDKQPLLPMNYETVLYENGKADINSSVKKVEHTIYYANDAKGTIPIHSKPSIMLSLKLAEVDDNNNNISDTFIHTIIDYGSWKSNPVIDYKKEF